MFDVPIPIKSVFHREKAFGTHLWGKRLSREIGLMLAIKVLVLYGLWLAFFSQPVIDSMIVGMDPERVASAVVPPATSFDSTTDSPQERSQ
jgi:hypothetical protein